MQCYRTRKHRLGYLRPDHTAFRVLTASESRPKNGTPEADAVKREEDAMKT